GWVKALTYYQLRLNDGITGTTWDNMDPGTLDMYIFHELTHQFGTIDEGAISLVRVIGRV
ncbi:MAG TPA: hypothetical protein VJN94_05630, partial [Candidatus Binataceae bacterium]|nr:hypothetical protein [Candidatus Binataceae bacterium]